jgi:hypothetical protein
MRGPARGSRMEGGTPTIRDSSAATSQTARLGRAVDEQWVTDPHLEPPNPPSISDGVDELEAPKPISELVARSW